MKIGVYGGTFNPPHLGHMTSARLAMEALGLDRLIFVPASIPPHKVLPEGSAPARERLAMTDLAADALLLPGKVSVEALELEREGKSYTSDTLEALKKRYPEDELWFLMGSDMLMSLHRWHAPERICSLARLAAFVRSEGDDWEAMAAQARALERDLGARVELLDLPRTVDISSTRLREALGQGGGREFLSEGVYGYILRRGLYGTHADLKRLSEEDLRACSLSMVYAKRHAHIRGVEQEAVRLARRWGADETVARRAGILHDCTKYLELEEQLALCEKYGLELDELERQSAKLLHSKTGAAVARHVYGESDAVYWAIYWHTTGRADMTLMEKIVYLADYMEPNRDFEGVEELRRLCDTDLDAALELGLRMSVEDLTQRGVPIHKNTQGALDYILAHRKG